MRTTSQPPNLGERRTKPQHLRLHCGKSIKHSDFSFQRPFPLLAPERLQAPSPCPGRELELSMASPAQPLSTRPSCQCLLSLETI